MHTSNSEKEIPSNEGFAQPTSTFTFRTPADPNDRLNRFLGYPQSGTAIRIQKQNPAAQPAADTKSRSSLVAEMLKQRRAEKEAKNILEVLPQPPRSTNLQPDSPETMRRVEENNAMIPQIPQNEPVQEEYEEPKIPNAIPDNAEAEVQRREFFTEGNIAELEEPVIPQYQTQPIESPRMPQNVRINVFDRLTADARRKQDAKKPIGAPQRKKTPSQDSRRSRSPKQGPRIEDRLMDSHKDHENWLRQERFRKQSKEMNELQSSPKISPESEKIVKNSPKLQRQIPPRVPRTMNPSNKTPKAISNPVIVQQRQVTFYRGHHTITIEDTRTHRRSEQNEQNAVLRDWRLFKKENAWCCYKPFRQAATTSSFDSSATTV